MTSPLRSRLSDHRLDPEVSDLETKVTDLAAEVRDRVRVGQQTSRYLSTASDTTSQADTQTAALKTKCAYGYR